MTGLTKDYSKAKQYLAKVLPWPQDGDPGWIGITYKSKGENGKWFWSTRGVTSVTQAVNTINWALNRSSIQDIYVCMGSLSKAEEIVSKRGFKYIKAERSQANVIGLKSLYIDLDAKGGDDSYDTVENAVTALFEFLKAAKFPAPSAMVRTGGGVHVYWTLDRILTPGEWLPLAHALVNAAKQFELKFDAGCSIDFARILRIPCTLNHKFTPPKHVELVTIEDFDYSVERISHALDPYKIATSTASNNYTANPELFKLNPTAISDNDLAAGIDQFQMPKPPLKDLARACPFVMEAITTGGATHQEPLWHNTMQLAMWTQEGEAAAQVMSMGHPDYLQSNTTEKYELAVEAQAEKGLGWPQCKTISMNGSKPCKTCTHLTAGKSPLNFVTMRPPTTINGVAFQSSIGGMQHVLKGDIDLPKGFIRDTEGFVSGEQTAEDGSTYYQRVLDYILVNPYLSIGMDTKTQLNFMTSTQPGVTKQVQLSAGLVAGHDMRRELQSNGIMMQSSEVKKVGEFFVSWTQRLQQIKEATSHTEQFGWSTIGPNVEGFAYGGSLYTPAGMRSAPASDHTLGSQYTPVGDLKVWYDAAKMITDQKRPALDAILAAAFAAPLVRCTGQPGLLMGLYSLKSGIGKTTAMKVAQAVWGDPVRALQGLNDTQNSVLNKLGKLRALPMFWDELKTSEDTKRMINLYFTITQGRERHRLKSNIEQRDVSAWETLLVSASNESMVDFVVHQTKMTTAGIYRMFEFTVDPGTAGRIAISDAARMISALGNNYGNAGQAYAQFLGSNFSRVDKEVAEEMLKVAAEVSVQEDERFWAALVAVIVLGAGYSNELGLTDIDVDKLREFMLAQFQGMRSLRADQTVDMEQSVNVANVLVQFLRDQRARNMLVTETMWRGRGKPKTGSIKVISDVSRLDALRVHVATKDKWLRISVSGLHEWLDRQQYPQHVFIEALKHKFGAIRTNSTMGAGTAFTSGSEFVLDIDMTQTTAKTYLQDLT